MKYLIWSHEHEMWWRPDERGYTNNVLEAGVYEQERAEEICAKANVGEGRVMEVCIPRLAIAGAIVPAVTLLQEAIDCPFTKDESAWNKWCEGWRGRAEAFIIDALAQRKAGLV